MRPHMHSSLKMWRPDASTEYGGSQLAEVLDLLRRTPADLPLGPPCSTLGAGIADGVGTGARELGAAGGAVEAGALGAAAGIGGAAALRGALRLAALEVTGAVCWARGIHNRALRPPMAAAATATRGSQLELPRGLLFAANTLAAVLGGSGTE